MPVSGLEADFSDASRVAFERYIGARVAASRDVFTWSKRGPAPADCTTVAGVPGRPIGGFRAEGGGGRLAGAARGSVRQRGRGVVSYLSP